MWEEGGRNESRTPSVAVPEQAGSDDGRVLSNVPSRPLSGGDGRGWEMRRFGSVPPEIDNVTARNTVSAPHRMRVTVAPLPPEMVAARPRRQPNPRQRARTPQRRIRVRPSAPNTQERRPVQEVSAQGVPLDARAAMIRAVKERTSPRARKHQLRIRHRTGAVLRGRGRRSGRKPLPIVPTHSVVVGARGTLRVAMKSPEQSGHDAKGWNDDSSDDEPLPPPWELRPRHPANGPD